MGLSVMLGCHHRQMQPVLLPVQRPVAIEPPPTETPLLVEAPKTKLPPVPVVQEQPKVKKTKKHGRTQQATASPAGSGADRAAAESAPGKEAAPVAPANPAGAATQSSDVGVFTVGGEQSAHARREASELIASNTVRLNRMGGEIARNQAALVSQVRTFQRDAQQALGSGDTEGARTLAMKGKLLLDDLERGVPSQ